MKIRALFIIILFFSFAPTVQAAPLKMLDYSECSKFFGLLSCNQQTEVCATNPNTGNPGCFLKTQVTNYINTVTLYPDLETCNQQSNCSYSCSQNNTLGRETRYFCNMLAPSNVIDLTCNAPLVLSADKSRCVPITTTAPASTSGQTVCGTSNVGVCQIACNATRPRLVSDPGNKCTGALTGAGGTSCCALALPVTTPTTPVTTPAPPGGTQTQTPPAGQPQTQTPPATTGTNITLVNPLGAGVGLMELLNKILAFVIQIGVIVVIFMLVYVGYLFVVAQGEPAKITAARQALLWTIVGALILLGSQAIAYGIQATVQALSVGK